MTAKILQIAPYKKELTLANYPFLAQEIGYKTQIFDPLVIDFFDTLSRQIITHKELAKIPEMVALAFWLRKANLNKIVEEHTHLTHSSKYIAYPIGTVFHICPANVDTLFLYSLATSMLMGNRNILRISQKLDDSYVILVFTLINEVLNQNFELLKDYISIINYERNQEINSYFSTHADARIIWGGDATVETFRKVDGNLRGKDLVFADRHSATILNAQIWQKSSDLEKQNMAAKLYSDAYSFDQKGCSCPTTLFFHGGTEACSQMERELYSLLLEQVLKKYQSDKTSLASLKLMQASTDAIQGAIESIINTNTALVFAKLADGKSTIPTSCGGGYFYTKTIEKLEALTPFINKRFQTLGYWGYTQAEIQEIAEITTTAGIDRIVPLGKALEFDYIWDGYNLIEELCSKKAIIYT